MPADPFAPSKVGRRNSKTHARVVKEVAMTGSDGESRGWREPVGAGLVLTHVSSAADTSTPRHNGAILA